MFFARLSATLRTLRFQLMLWNFAAGVLTALGILVAVREGVRYTLINDLDHALREDVREIRSRFDAPGEHDWRALEDELNRKAATHDYHGWFVVFLDSGARATWSSQNTPAGLVAFSDQQRSAGVFHVAQHRIRYEPLEVGGELAAIAVGCNEAFIARDMAHIDQLVLIVGGIVILIAPIGGYLLAGRTTRILADLIHTTDRLRPSELKERLPIRGTGDELDSLARTINGLLDRIADYLQQRHDFLANAAHELRTPLAAIRSSVEVAANGEPSEREYRELLDEVIEQCTTLQTIVNQLLLLAESDADRLITSAEPMSLDELVARAIDMFQAVAEFHGIELSANQPLPTAIIANRHRLRQVLNNLLDNAIKFTASRYGGCQPAGDERPQERGRIDVRLVRDDQRQIAILRISDNGIGIGPDSLPRIFERFYRADGSRRREGGPGGSGLGLSICQAIVAAHHGTIAATSEPGRGATFTITLPLAPAACEGNLVAIRPAPTASELDQADDR